MILGKLEEVDVRELWKHEQYDFSKWLAKEDNLEYLNEILGLTLIDVEQEVYVGTYRCDIVAKEDTSNSKIIIENQLEQSNHDHLGKIITYASGLDANVIVWIVKEAREEHRSAIEWLNNNTNEDLNFFLIELHAYKIGDSLPAPKFEVIEKPNVFIKSGKNATNQDGEQKKTEAKKLDFWNQLNEILKKEGKPFNVKPTPHSFYTVPLGLSSINIKISLNNRDSKITVELYIQDNKNLYDTLYSLKESIEKDFEFPLEWQRQDGKKVSRIKHIINGLNFEKQDNYPELMREVIDKVVKLRDTFNKNYKLVE